MDNAFMAANDSQMYRVFSAYVTAILGQTFVLVRHLPSWSLVIVRL
jgi:hypothetical protein